MKLRNKNTGEIIEKFPNVFVVNSGERIMHYNSLAALNEEWEDYEETKEYWYIDWNGEVCRSDIHDGRTNQMKLIGNYFETREEAEKAVEKLKAIEKLKEYELHIEWANTPEYDEDEDRWYCSVDFSVREGCNGDILFNLLFGGEE